MVFALVVVHDFTTAKMPGDGCPRLSATTSKRQNAISSSMSPPRRLFGFDGGFFSIGGEIGFTKMLSCSSPWNSISPSDNSISLPTQPLLSVPYALHRALLLVKLSDSLLPSVKLTSGLPYLPS